MDIASKATIDERMAARWERIKNRRHQQDAEGEGHDTVSPSGEVQASKSISKTALLTSRNRIGQLQTEARKQVTSIQLRSDKREYERRQADVRTKAQQAKRLEEEAEQSQTIMEEIDAKWAAIVELKVPQEIAEEIQKQEDQCAKVVKAKARVNEELEAEVRAKSEEFTNLIKTQENEIAELLHVMHAQFQNVQQGYQQELDTIEAAFLEERKQMLEGNRNQIDECFENRRAMELQILDSKLKRDQKYQDDLDELRLRDTEDYNKLKMNLENNVQLLEQQLEEMRSTYQLNTEKLNYNFQVLKEREKENMDTVDHQKRKLKRLSATLRSLKQKYAEQDKRFKQENHELTEEYRRITRQYKELQRKFRHFEKVDSKKYDDIWTMNQESIVGLVKKILQADKIIHEQILCIPWEAPPNIDLIIDPNAEPVPIEPTTTKESDGTTTGASNGPLANRIASGKALSSSEADVRLRKVLTILAVEAAFLIDPKVQEAVAQFPDNERLLYQCDSILRALGVDDKDDLDEIASMFFQHDGSATNEGDESGASQVPIVHPNDFLKVIRKYVANRQAKSTSGNSAADKQAEPGETDKSNAEKRERKKNRDKEFWTRLVNVIDPQKIKVWNALESSLLEYNTILNERAEIVAETRQLTEQNEQLKLLLEQYLSSKINQELNIPPTHVLQFPKI
ncbi:unnamed protein product (mitochondrion) [Plasmodiophora brassicae]|uniref:Dynein regulatory complex protein 1 n=1 Tax=Plasmodiophora brassicae TaxID=37360 RepID=A0A0G4J509_PLABS|nr:hypothetical protein PBRA_002650 [Plasmodiophora brassicae]SPQ94808.1 unnamed protein product [Plasmodiophora brassicae]